MIDWPHRSFRPFSLLAILWLTSACAPEADKDFKLQAGDEARPELILRKHLSGTNEQDRRIAKSAYEDGTVLRRRQVAPELRWGPVYKAFCESALRHPTSPALVACADAAIQSMKLSDAADTSVHRRNLLGRVCMVLTSALVLDELDRGLTPEQRSLAKADRDCVADYLSDYGHGRKHCGPVAVLFPETE
jgi:hypothetical protein